MVFLSQLALEKYEEMFPAFTDSRECKLLKVSNIRILKKKVFAVRWDCVCSEGFFSFVFVFFASVF